MSVKDFRLPDLGEGLEQGDIVAWLVAVGDTVELNQPVADIETAKAVVTVPSPFAGRVVELLGEVGETLDVGSVLLRIDTAVDGSSSSGDATASPPADGEGEEPKMLVGYGQRESARPRRSHTGAAPSDRTPVTPGRARALAKPPVRRLARDLGVELAAIAPGSGPGGVITRGDVEAAAGGDGRGRPDEPPGGSREPARPVRTLAGGVPEELAGDRPPATHPTARPAAAGFRGRTPGDVEPLRGIRKRIAEKMEAAHHAVPSASCRVDVDVTAMWELAGGLTAQARSEDLDVKITPFVILMRATLLSLRRFPTLNARLVGREGPEPGEIHLLEDIHLGFAVDTDRGLVVPNLKHAMRRSLVELAHDTAELTAQARRGDIRPDDLVGGTFTVNNYGAFGCDDGNPIVNHPEVGILGVGAMRDRPWVHDGEVVVRRVATLRLAFDHRVSDGAEAGHFLGHVATLCEEPARLLLHA